MASPNIPSFDDPTLRRLDVDPSFIDTASPIEQATKWLRAFEASISAQEIDSLVYIFHEYGFWKDILTLTWDLRTIRGHPSIRRLLDARLAATGLSAFHLLEDTIRGPTIIRPYPDLVFIRFCFDFETKHGKGISVAFLVPTSSGTWKAWSLLTRLESLKAYPEKTGVLRTRLSHDESWEDRRRCETDFNNGDPAVLIIGAGHAGLEMAARLTCLGVPTLIIERNQRVGDNWRTRYNTVRLHATVWNNRMPYLDYPKTWPVYCPGSKFGDWLESYASSLDLNVWLRSSITSTNFDQKTRTWEVSIGRDGKPRTMRVKHLVFATGFGGGFPKTPNIPGKELYRGSVLHSTQFTSARDHEGKKVIIIGSGTSAHDIAHDLRRHGCDVTMIQRSPTYVISQEAFEISRGGMANSPVIADLASSDPIPFFACKILEKYNEHFPVEFADILTVAMPFATLKFLSKDSVAAVANGIDKKLLGNLTRAGFQTYLGPDGTGLLMLIFQSGGGFYIDTGTSQEIINGTIKVKSGSVRRFTESGLELEDEAILKADLVVFATGFGDIRSSIAEVCGPDVAAKVGNMWDLDAEGELRVVWRSTGHPRLWIAMSNFTHTRIHSLHLALRIKAIEEGIVGDEEIWN